VRKKRKKRDWGKIAETRPLLKERGREKKMKKWNVGREKKWLHKLSKNNKGTHQPPPLKTQKKKGKTRKEKEPCQQSHKPPPPPPPHPPPPPPQKKKTPPHPQPQRFGCVGVVCFVCVLCLGVFFFLLVFGPTQKQKTKQNTKQKE